MDGEVDGEVLALFVAIGVPIVLRVLDYLLPQGRHFRFVGRFSEPDDGDGSEGVGASAHPRPR